MKPTDRAPRIMDAGIHRSAVAATTAEPRADAGFGKGLSINYMDKIALRFGSDLVVAISTKPQA